MAVRTEEVPTTARRGLVWKQFTLTPEQAVLVKEMMRDRRWTFQSLAQEAFKVYFQGQGKPWPEREAK